MCGCKINDLMKEETGTHPLLSSLAPRLSWSLCSPDPYPAPISAWSFSSYPALLRPPLPRNCRLPRTLFRFRDCVGCASAAELQSHRRILALGLTLKTPNDLPTTNLPEYQSRGGRDRRDAAERGLRAIANEFHLQRQRQGRRRVARASTQMPRVAAYFHSIGRYLPQTRYLRSLSSDGDATLNTSLIALATDKDQTNREERIVLDVVEWSWGLVELAWFSKVFWLFAARAKAATCLGPGFSSLWKQNTWKELMIWKMSRWMKNELLSFLKLTR